MGACATPLNLRDFWFTFYTLAYCEVSLKKNDSFKFWCMNLLQCAFDVLDAWSTNVNKKVSRIVPSWRLNWCRNQAMNNKQKK